VASAGRVEMESPIHRGGGGAEVSLTVRSGGRDGGLRAERPERSALLGGQLSGAGCPAPATYRAGDRFVGHRSQAGSGNNIVAAPRDLPGDQRRRSSASPAPAAGWVPPVSRSPP